MWVADATGADARALVPCGAGCLSLDYPAWSPDGRFIAFTHYNADPPPTAGPPAANSLRVLDLRSGRQRVIARSTFPELLDLPRWSPPTAGTWSRRSTASPPTAPRPAVGSRRCECATVTSSC